MPAPAPPTVAKVASLSDWTNLFHPTTGAFRLPSTAGQSIEHLDIDLRFVHDEDDDHRKDPMTLPITGQVHLPRVCVLILRGAEHVQDSEERMDRLAEVLLAMKPVEVHWLNANNDPDEQLTFSTHLVHPAIIAAGEIWARQGCLKRLIIQGGFPCPNLSAPTPYSLTPAATPCHSPGPNAISFGGMASQSNLPSLSTLKPKKLIDNAKLHERFEKKRLAEYSLKPRYSFAFGSWGTEEIHWRVDGRYTSACIRAIVQRLFEAFAKTYPSPSEQYDLPFPSLLFFSPLSPPIIEAIRDLTDKLESPVVFRDHLTDVSFAAPSVDSESLVRVWPSEIREMDRQRASRRMKAEMLLIASGRSIFPTDGSITCASDEQKIFTDPSTPDFGGSARSIAGSYASLTLGDIESATEDEGEAVTPDMGSSLLIESTDMGWKQRQDPSVTGSLVV